jgi:hypothetical protein
MSFNYHASRTFARVHQDRNPFIFIRGPVGSGKSVGSIMHLFLTAMAQTPGPDGVRRTRFGVIRATYPALKSTVIKSWEAWFGGMMRIVYDVPIRGILEMPHPDGETTLRFEQVFIALDREEQVNKLQSLELTGAHINEATEIPKAILQMLKSRVNRYPAEKDGGPDLAQIIMDYNSPDTEHWLYQLAEEERPQGHSFYVQPPALLWTGSGYKTNPNAENLGHYEPGDPRNPPTKKSIWVPEANQWWVPHLAHDYYLNMTHGADPDWINVFVLNNYGVIRQGKPVYPHYQDSVHCANQPFGPIQGVPLIIGMDLGLTPAAAFMQLTPMGQLKVFDEIVTEDCSVQKFISDYLKPKIIQDYPGYSYEIVVDPAATFRSQNDARCAAEYIREAGLPYRPAKTNNALARREAVNYFLLRQGGLMLSPVCKTLRKGFVSEYQYEQIKTAMSVKYRETPQKNIFSHVHDALQYGALELQEGRVTRRKARRGAFSNYHPAERAAGY